MYLNKDIIIRALEKVFQKISLTEEIARDLESTILENYPDADEDEVFEGVLHMLASYEPSGGDYLYNEKQIKKECKRWQAPIFLDTQ